MKTILQWLEELPEPYRSQAIENCKNDKPFTGNHDSISLLHSISEGFIWRNTQEGCTYWGEICQKLINGELLTDEPSHGIEPGQVWGNKKRNLDKIILGVSDELVFFTYEGTIGTEYVNYVLIDEFLNQCELIQS